MKHVRAVDRRTAVRTAVCDHLEREGYRAESVSGYRAAMALLRRRPPLQAAVVDYDLRAEGTGVRLAEELAALGIAVAVTADIPADRDRVPGPPILAKPFHLREMLAYVRAATGRR